MKTYDAIIVKGRGVTEDGSISDNVKATVARAVELYKQGVAPRIIFSGKWSYKVAYVPANTEAGAMAEYAKTLGLPDEAVLKEEQSNTTVSNCYHIKTLCLEPRGYKNVILVSMRHVGRRAMYNLEHVLGPDYHVDFEPVDVVSTEENLELQKLEDKKMGDVEKFYAPFTPGDHETIYKAAQKELKEKYMPLHSDHKSYEELEKDLADAASKVEIGGTYIHYKYPDRPYKVLRLSLLEENNEVAVEYSPIGHDKIIWVRPLSLWLESVEWNGEKIPRFKKIEKAV